MKTYRGWKISQSFVAYKSGTTIYGDNLTDIKWRIDVFMKAYK